MEVAVNTTKLSRNIARTLDAKDLGFFISDILDEYEECYGKEKKDLLGVFFKALEEDRKDEG